MRALILGLAGLVAGGAAMAGSADWNNTWRVKSLLCRDKDGNPADHCHLKKGLKWKISADSGTKHKLEGEFLNSDGQTYELTTTLEEKGSRLVGPVTLKHGEDEEDHWMILSLAYDEDQPAGKKYLILYEFCDKPDADDRCDGDIHEGTGHADD